MLQNKKLEHKARTFYFVPYTRLNYEHLNSAKSSALQKEESVVWDGSSVLKKENDLESMLLKVRDKETTKDELVMMLADILTECFTCKTRDVEKSELLFSKHSQ